MPMAGAAREGAAFGAPDWTPPRNRPDEVATLAKADRT